MLRPSEYSHSVQYEQMTVLNQYYLYIDKCQFGSFGISSTFL
jgi:hypothetical protein